MRNARGFGALQPMVTLNLQPQPLGLPAVLPAVPPPQPAPQYVPPAPSRMWMWVAGGLVLAVGTVLVIRHRRKIAKHRSKR